MARNVSNIYTNFHYHIEWFHKSCKQIDDKYFDIPDIYPIIVLINIACTIVLFFVIVMPLYCIY